MPHVYQGPTTPTVNRLVMWFARRGVSLMGARILTVRGRTSGEPRRAPVNPLTHEGALYLVAPRGHVQWTRNLRASGEAELRLGRGNRVYRATEVSDDAKAPLLRAYLARWKGEVGKYFEADSLDTRSTDEQWQAVASHYPVFALTERG
ncbi:nitroreductase family deazaflavin-dependent oxidoreductase [Streptomyces otsuchiensis]|uniref:nitroreductase family deazaflavin-dependent oxidoreductase n=1 Tax=Streptomyces otsuchiensis TaxID=2681388 RepID=UPI003F689C1F